jgi:hypothetical protein
VIRAAAVLFAGALAAQTPVFVVGEVSVASVPCVADGTLCGTMRNVDLKPDAALDSVVLLRLAERDSVTVVVDVGAMVRIGGMMNVHLMPGDAIYVPPRHAAAPRPTPDELLDAARRALLASPIAGEQRAWLQRDVLVRTGDRVARHQAALDLAQGCERELAVRLLVSALDRDASIAREAATALGTMGTDAKAALPALRQLRDHRDADLRARVAAAIRQIEAAGTGPR